MDEQLSPITGRDRTLAQLVAMVRAQGLRPDASLRYIADELGTSHRMLTYYFGSRDGLLAAVLTAMRNEERALLTATAADWGLRDAALAMWSYYIDPRRLEELRAFFYVFSLALERPEVFADFLLSMDSWVTVVTDIGIAEGKSRADARAQGQLIVSAVRGLLMDRLSTTEPKPVDAAFLLLLDAVIPAPGTTARGSRPKVASQRSVSAR